MAIRPCSNWTCECEADWPIANLSAEQPDEPSFNSIRFPTDDPPWGTTYGSQGCLFWCSSTVSQQAADICALAQESLCHHDDDNDDESSDGGDSGGTPGGSSTSYASAPQSCSVDCPNGDVYTHTLPAGYVIADSQVAADLMAQHECAKQAMALRICFEDDSVFAICLGDAFDHTFSILGGTSPFWFSADPMSLPNGVYLNPNGNLSGVPADAGEYVITIIATDSGSPARTLSKTITIYVVEITSPSVLTGGAVGVPYSYTLAHSVSPSGGLWSISAGSLPPNTALNPATGLISGTPTVAGLYVFTVSLVST